jgi:hypothetical protein
VLMRACSGAGGHARIWSRARASDGAWKKRLAKQAWPRFTLWPPKNDPLLPDLPQRLSLTKINKHDDPRSPEHCVAQRHRRGAEKTTLCSGQRGWPVELTGAAIGGRGGCQLRFSCACCVSVQCVSRALCPSASLQLSLDRVLQGLKNACPVRTVRKDYGVSVVSLRTRVTGGRNISLLPAPQPTLGLEHRGCLSTPTVVHLVSDIPPLAIGPSTATPPSVAPRRRTSATAPSARCEHAQRQLREGRRHGTPIGINQARVWAAEEALQRLGRFCLRHRACAQHLHRAQHSSPPIPRWACRYCGDRRMCG